MKKEKIYDEIGLDAELIKISNEVFEELKEIFNEVDEIASFNQIKVLKAMQKAKLSDIHFAATTGYGYNDLGRDKIEEIYKTVFKAEDALVRPQIVSGTHALNLALSGNLRPNDELLSVVGLPYDTLLPVIGIKETRGSLIEYGVKYKQVDLKEDGSFDFIGIKNAINENTKMVLIQRSKGYSTRVSLSIEKIEKVISYIREIKKDIIILVDNCYGEFVEEREPIEVGADLIVGSLIKNPGGGLAPIGGYIVGKKEFVENAAYRLTAPGLGKELGATLGINQSILQGLFLAPSVVASALKGAILAANLFEKFGFTCVPSGKEKRADIVQAIILNKKEAVISFCEAIQEVAPVDSFISPIPSYMPGYDCDVIMAAGAFVSGSSIELSADAPMREPYVVFFQGGLTFYHAKYAILFTLKRMREKGII